MTIFEGSEKSAERFHWSSFQTNWIAGNNRILDLIERNPSSSNLRACYFGESACRPEFEILLAPHSNSHDRRFAAGLYSRSRFSGSSLFANSHLSASSSCRASCLGSEAIPNR